MSFDFRDDVYALDYKSEAIDLASSVLAYDRAVTFGATDANTMNLALEIRSQMLAQARRVLGISVLSVQGGSTDANTEEENGRQGSTQFRNRHQESGDQKEIQREKK